MNGIDLIKAERERQISMKGYEAARDDEYTNGQLAGAGACYALTAAQHWMRDQVIARIWPWPAAPMPTNEKDHIANLSKAGALIAAEIDRLLRFQKADDKNVYLGDWGNKDDMASSFFQTRYDNGGAQKATTAMNGVEILLAYYLYEDYTGKAFVLFRKDESLYEVNGSHCSCYGLEDQWEPEATSVDSLRHRLDNGNLGCDYDGKNEFAKELREVLNRIAPVGIAA